MNSFSLKRYTYDGRFFSFSIGLIYSCAYIYTFLKNVTPSLVGDEGENAIIKKEEEKHPLSLFLIDVALAKNGRVVIFRHQRKKRANGKQIQT